MASLGHSPAVVGVADHSGWASLVTVGVDDRRRPIVLDRRRSALVGPDVPRQPYHAAAGLDGAAAEALVRRVEAAARSGARTALADLAADVGPGCEVVALTLRSGAGRGLPDSVAGVLASHAAMHAAEGALYRDALAEAASALGLDVVVQARGTTAAEAARALGTDAAGLAVLLGAFGQAVGPPWRKEHREAAAGAVAELARLAPVTLAV
jgi:hypothetical protein